MDSLHFILEEFGRPSLMIKISQLMSPTIKPPDLMKKIVANREREREREREKWILYILF